MSEATEDFSPIEWTAYFDSRKLIYVNGNSFNVYFKGEDGPAIVTLHGGGYSGLTWSLFAKEINTKVTCQILAIDLRGHGLTETVNDADLDLATLANDVSDVLNEVNDSSTPVILVGHSMGGAVAVEASLNIQSVVALCVIDVVEGSALASFTSMSDILRERPSGFKSLETAIKWSIDSGQTTNIEAARISMPSQVKNIETGVLGTIDAEIINDGIQPIYKGVGENVYTWRIDLTETEQFWNGWFEGLSEKFLNVTVPKVLLLANIEALDTALTIEQMQGKFQLEVFRKSGHAIHEDQPGHVADIIGSFLVKHKFAKSNKK